MENQLFINGKPYSMQKIKFMRRLQSKDNDPSKDVIYVAFEPNGSDEIPCTVENVTSLALWLNTQNSILESSLHAALSELAILKKDLARLAKLSEPKNGG